MPLKKIWYSTRVFLQPKDQNLIFIVQEALCILKNKNVGTQSYPTQGAMLSSESRGARCKISPLEYVS